MIFDNLNVNKLVKLYKIKYCIAMYYTQYSCLCYQVMRKTEIHLMLIISKPLSVNS